MKKYCEPNIKIIQFIPENEICNASLTGGDNKEGTIPEDWEYGD